MIHLVQRWARGCGLGYTPGIRGEGNLLFGFWPTAYFVPIHEVFAVIKGSPCDVEAGGPSLFLL